MKKKKGLIIAAVIIPILFFFVIKPSGTKQQKPNYDEFAQCLTDKGVKMYGAYWCPHCKNEKALFGSSFEKVTYVECSLPDGQTQTKECSDAGIEGYPTWDFGNGDRISGEVDLQTLSDKTGCQLPN